MNFHGILSTMILSGKAVLSFDQFSFISSIDTGHADRFDILKRNPAASACFNKEIFFFPYVIMSYLTL